MSSHERQPTRVSMTVGSTSRHGGEFEFRKISLSLDRDLAPLENPVDAYRDIKALLEGLVNEFQAGKPAVRVQQEPKPAYRGKQEPSLFHGVKQDPKSAGTSTPAGTPTPAGNGNRTVPPRPAAPKPAGLTVETLHERLAKWLPDLEILDGFDGFAVKPKRYLGDTWAEINEVMRSLGGHWQKGLKSTDGAWRIPK